MTGDFHGQVALVTGASRGLGAAYARILAQLGCRIALNDLPDQAAELDDTRATLASFGADVLVLPHDVVRDANDIVASVLKRFGRLDVVINNAGVTGGGCDRRNGGAGIRTTP